jgi:pimeloyl-ACP methyl ester carboxylesterase
MRHLALFTLLALAAYALLCVAMFALQRSLQYFPDPSPMDPAAAGLPQARSQTLVTRDGERLAAWWVAPRDAQAPVYLYLHGNGAHLHARAPRFAQLVADGAGLFAPSWRGYGGSTGSPTEPGLRLDAIAAYDALRGRGIGAERIVLYGESLGAAVAVMLAGERPVRALLLDSAFASALDIAAGAYPWLPVRLLMRDTYRADLVAPLITVPVLQVHCADDPVTPLASARALHARLPHARPLVRVDGRCHVPELPTYDAARRAFVGALFAGPPGTGPRADAAPTLRRFAGGEGR